MTRRYDGRTPDERLAPAIGRRGADPDCAARAECRHGPRNLGVLWGHRAARRSQEECPVEGQITRAELGARSRSRYVWSPAAPLRWTRVCSSCPPGSERYAGGIRLFYTGICREPRSRHSDTNQSFQIAIVASAWGGFVIGRRRETARIANRPSATNLDLP